MGKKRKLAIMLCIISAILINIYIFRMVKPDINNGNYTFVFSMNSNQPIDVQVFYADSTEFSEIQSSTLYYAVTDTMTDMAVKVPIGTRYIRIDFGNAANQTAIGNAHLEVGGKKISISLKRFLEPLISNCIREITEIDDKVVIYSLDTDPYIVINLDDINIAEAYYNAYQTRYLVYDVVLCAIVDLMVLFGVLHLKNFGSVPLDIYHNRDILWDLVKNDFQARFAGSYFGVFWAFVQPVITMCLYWFVFQVGLRAGNASDYPFILFLMSGMIPWFYFSDALNGGTNSLIEYSYLVKKVVFEVRILPVVKVVSNIFVHLFFVAVIEIVCLCYGFTPDFYLLQIIYYIACSSFLVLGLSYITSSCTAFFKDMTQIVNIILTIGVWATPIMWTVDMLSPILRLVFRLNPVYYIVDGFRDTLLAKRWFWEKPVWTIYFWVFSILVYMLGVDLFNRLKVHFSDVL